MYIFESDLLFYLFIYGNSFKPNGLISKEAQTYTYKDLYTRYTVKLKQGCHKNKVKYKKIKLN